MAENPHLLDDKIKSAAQLRRRSALPLSPCRRNFKSKAAICAKKRM
jgi:hypothetical protein